MSIKCNPASFLDASHDGWGVDSEWFSDEILSEFGVPIPAWRPVWDGPGQMGFRQRSWRKLWKERMIDNGNSAYSWSLLNKRRLTKCLNFYYLFKVWRGHWILSDNFLQGAIINDDKILQVFPGVDIERYTNIILRNIPREAYSYRAAGEIDGELKMVLVFNAGEEKKTCEKLWKFLTMTCSVRRLIISWKLVSGLCIGNIFWLIHCRSM